MQKKLCDKQKFAKFAMIFNINTRRFFGIFPSALIKVQTEFSLGWISFLAEFAHAPLAVNPNRDFILARPLFIFIY